MSPDGVAESAGFLATLQTDSQHQALLQHRNVACVLLHTQRRDEEGMKMSSRLKLGIDVKADGVSEK